MKYEYQFTEAQKAELAHIDRQIHMLVCRKAEIYAASGGYIFRPENDEEVKSIERLIESVQEGIVPLHNMDGILGHVDVSGV